MRHGIDRRRFLQLAGLSGAAALAGRKQSESAPTPPPGPSRSATSPPPPVPWPGSARPTPSSSAASGKALEGGLEIGGTSYPVEIITKDSQSDPNRAAAVAGDLINADQIDLMLVASTPETTNPVADQCEANGIPCISSVAPWQPWFFGRGGDPEKPFLWTYHFFWGLEDIIAVFTDMWGQVDNNKSVAALWPNDGDGNAWGDKKTGFPPALEEAGYEIVDPGRYQNGTEDFSSQIASSRRPTPRSSPAWVILPDWTPSGSRSSSRASSPRSPRWAASLFPASVEALGDIGNGMSTEVWWSPRHPFKSSLNWATRRLGGRGVPDRDGKVDLGFIGFVHALFEVAAAALKASGSVDDKQALANAIKGVNLDTVVGKISWSGGPVPNVAKTPLVGGQARKGTGKYLFELVIVQQGPPGDPQGRPLDLIPYS